MKDSEMLKKTHERFITFFKRDGHNHNGENSTEVEILPGRINLFHLNDALKEWILSQGDEDSDGGGDVFPVPDLNIQTPPIGPGASYEGTADWVTLTFVRHMRILMSVSTECRVTFYHSPTFADEDREFRVINAANKFLWEGAWAHYDETQGKKLYYKVENTGNQASIFNIELKSATMVANAYARFVEHIQVGGTQLTGPLTFYGGNGVNITADGLNVTFDAVAPETIYISRYALAPVKPTDFTASAAITNESNLYVDNSNSASFDTGLQYIIADLGSAITLGKIKAIFPYSDGRIVNSVRVQVSADGGTWLTLKDSGSFWSTSDGVECNIPTGYIARYIRVWSNGSSTSATNSILNVIPYTLTNKAG